MINIVMTTSLYDDLELPKTCTSEEIKQKYRTLAQIHHPDKGGNEEKFKRMPTKYHECYRPYAEPFQ
jgi:DnaJ family protein A protein 2